jgi:hypothetical protein
MEKLWKLVPGRVARSPRPLCAWKLIFRMRPSVPASHPAFGLAKAIAQKPDTPAGGNQVSPSSGVQAAPPSVAVITTAASPWGFPAPWPVSPT